MDKETLNLIEDTIGYHFSEKSILQQAFIRKSYSHEHNEYEDNEVLEFYGDSALDYFITRKMCESFGSIENRQFVSSRNESELTRLKSQNVDKENLSYCIDLLGFHNYLIMGESDIKNNVNDYDSVKEDLFEAIVGAVAVDSEWNFQEITIVCHNMLSMVKFNNDYIWLLQDWCERIGENEPKFDVSHNLYNFSSNPMQEFICKLTICNQSFEETGNTRFYAKMAAAEKAYDELYGQILISEVGEPGERNPVIQLHELYQKDYIDEPEYNYEESHDNNGNPTWKCYCEIDDENQYWAEASSKKDAKRDVAYNVLCDLMDYK